MYNGSLKKSTSIVVEFALLKFFGEMDPNTQYTFMHCTVVYGEEGGWIGAVKASPF